MIILHKDGGSGELELLDQSLTSETWARLRQSVAKLLRRRGSPYAADLLDRYPFQVFAGTNTFGDQFDVLYTRVGTDDYLDLANRKEDFDIKKRRCGFAIVFAQLSIAAFDPCHDKQMNHRKINP